MRRYPERLLLLLLAAVQFTHILDFMVMMPLGEQLMRELAISPAGFSHLVAAYTLSAGVVGLLTAPFMDRHDRKKILLVVYAGFTLGTLGCGLAHTAGQLLAARAICGAFGGVSGATLMSIVSDLVPPERRAAGMGVIMAAFAVAAALGVPFGLYLAQVFRWEMPFLMVAGLGAVIWVLILIVLPPVRGHLDSAARQGFHTFWELLRDRNAGRALVFMSALVMGHITIIPLLAPYLVSNAGLPENRLFLVYLAGGVSSAVTAPWLGRLADRRGHLRIYTLLIGVACVITLFLTHAPPLSLGVVLLLTSGFFIFASGRFIPAQAMISLAVPARRRGSFMSLSSCTRDLTTGFTTSLGGWIVTKSSSGQLVHYNVLGWIAVGVSLFSLWLAKRVQANEVTSPALTGPTPVVE